MTASLDKRTILHRYRNAAGKKLDHEKARWGSHESMMNRYRLALKLVDFSRVRSWLDYGVGPGVFQSVVAKKFSISRMVGVDIVEDMLIEAKSRAIREGYNLQVIHSDFEELSISDPKFDLITAVGVLHCCAVDFNILFAKMATQLKFNGQFFITTMNREWVGFNISHNSPNPEHEWFTASEICDGLLANDLKPCSIRGLLPRTGEIVDPNDGYCIGIYGNRA